MSKPNLTVLIVDDEPLIRKSMSHILTSLGHSVRCAEDGFTALARIKEACPDVLLSDLYMAGMSGFELLAEVRRRLPGIYVIATSGSFSGPQVPQGVAADAFYEKATRLSLLVQIMERGVRWKQGTGRRSRASTRRNAPARIQASEITLLPIAV
jgi:CheY-like chemotaxis protein